MDCLFRDAFRNASLGDVSLGDASLEGALGVSSGYASFGVVSPRDASSRNASLGILLLKMPLFTDASLEDAFVECL